MKKNLNEIVSDVENNKQKKNTFHIVAIVLSIAALVKFSSVESIVNWILELVETILDWALFAAFILIIVYFGYRLYVNNKEWIMAQKDKWFGPKKTDAAPQQEENQQQG